LAYSIIIDAKVYVSSAMNASDARSFIFL
jgi:hypothetical protein